MNNICAPMINFSTDGEISFPSSIPIISNGCSLGGILEQVVPVGRRDLASEGDPMTACKWCTDECSEEAEKECTRALLTGNDEPLHRHHADVT